MVSIDVWVGNFGDYAVPKSIIDEAKKINGLMSIADRRTKGFRLIKEFGEAQDEKENTKEN